MDSNLENMMDAIVSSILETKEYLHYKDALKALENEQGLLEEYQNALNNYQEMKKYEKYIDVSNSKEKFIEVKKRLGENQIVIDYYLALNDLNDLLDEITKTIFDGLLDPSLLQPYFK